MLARLTRGACLWPAAMIVWGPGYAAARHRHHSVQLLMAMDGMLRIRGGRDQAWLECGAVLVRADATHEVDVPASTVLLAFVDPESQLGASLSQRIAGDISPVPTPELARWRRAIAAGGALSEARIEAWVSESLLNGMAPERIHPRVARVLRYLRAQPGVLGDVSLPTLAAIAGLSESRLMHVFTRSLGVAVRPYILWLRVQRACGELLRGHSVTDAAHEAGFADSAHLARTFRRMLGVTPSQLGGSHRVARAVSVQDELAPFTPPSLPLERLTARTASMKPRLPPLRRPAALVPAETARS
jgi:AraC-like DNA-binding protein